MINPRQSRNHTAPGSVTQTLDVLDFATVHLSWYERLQSRYHDKTTEIMNKKRLLRFQKHVNSSGNHSLSNSSSTSTTGTGTGIAAQLSDQPTEDFRTGHTWLWGGLIQWSLQWLPSKLRDIVIDWLPVSVKQTMGTVDREGFPILVQYEEEDEEDDKLSGSLYNLDRLEGIARKLKKRALKIRKSPPKSTAASASVAAASYLNRTLAIMPFLGSERGAGNSKEENRFLYLEACFWSIYAEITHIVVFVKSEADLISVRNTSGLPFYDVVLLKNLPKNAALPVATVQETKARIVDGRWDFDYIYFTESDQILMMRIPEDLYGHLKRFPRRVVIPHRLTPYPEAVLVHVYHRNASKVAPQAWMNMTCCLPRQNCLTRREWKSIQDHAVPHLNIYGFQVALGESQLYASHFPVPLHYLHMRITE
jgi:hypothetical protein